MSDDDTERSIRDYYRSITPTDASRVQAEVQNSIEIRRRKAVSRRGVWQLGGAVGIAALLALAVLSAPIVLGPAATPRLIGPVASAPTMSPAPTASSATPRQSSLTMRGSWITLLSASGAGAVWSADGAYLAMWTVPTSGPSEDMLLLDGNGNLVRPLDADKIVWLNAKQFILQKAGVASLGSVDTDALTPISYSFASAETLTNDHGAVALSVPDPNSPDTFHFMIWTAEGVTKALEGEVVAWSTDGTEFAIWHPKPATGPGGVGFQDTGSITVMAWPSLEQVASVPGTDLVAQETAFDPSGRYLLVSNLGDAGSFVYDLQGRKVVGPEKIIGVASWQSNDNLLVPGTNGAVNTYRLDTSTIATEDGIGDSAISSADGSAIATYFSEDYSGIHPLTLIRNGTRLSVGVPGGLEEAPVIAANGSGVVIVCLIDYGKATEHTELLLLKN